MNYNKEQNFPGEQWATVDFGIEYTNGYRLDVSSYGRIKSFHKSTEGNILKGSLTNGYPTIRIQFFKPRDPETQKQFDFLQKQVQILEKQIKQLKLDGKPENEIAETVTLLGSFKKNLKNKMEADRKSRTIHYQSLIHKLVAIYFIPRPSLQHTVVAHIDHNKGNNMTNNLKWMTPEENYEHQKTSPLVIKEKRERHEGLKEGPSSPSTKLTITKVMLLKKLLAQGKPIKQLVKQFKISETQIFRIKRGENWGYVEAAN